MLEKHKLDLADLKKKEKKRQERQRTNIYYNNFGEQFELEKDNNDWEDLGTVG